MLEEAKWIPTSPSPDPLPGYARWLTRPTKSSLRESLRSPDGSLLDLRQRLAQSLDTDHLEPGDGLSWRIAARHDGALETVTGRLAQTFLTKGHRTYLAGQS